MSKLLACFFLTVMLSGCDYFPKDPHETLQIIRQTKIIRIAVIEHTPWAYRENGSAKGIEVAIVRDFAGSLGAGPQWNFMSEAEAEDHLKQHHVDMVIGGLTKANPRKKAMGFTRSYFETGDGQKHQHVLAVPKGENRFLVRLEKFLKEHQSRIQRYYAAELEK